MALSVRVCKVVLRGMGVRRIVTCLFLLLNFSVRSERARCKYYTVAVIVLPEVNTVPRFSDL